MLAYFDPIILLLFLIALVILVLVSSFIFLTKYNFANILIILGCFQRYYVYIGFALQPYLIFSLSLFGGILFKRDLHVRLFHLLRIVKPIALPLLGLTLSFFVSGLLTGFDIISFRQHILLIWSWIIIGFYLILVQGTSEIIKTNKFIMSYSRLFAIIGIVCFILYLLGFGSLASDRYGQGFIYQNPGVAYGRLRCFDTDPNSHALYTLPLFFCTVGWIAFCMSTDKSIVLPLLNAILLFVNLILTFSRGAFISVFSGLFFAFLITRLNIRNSNRNAIRLGIIIAGLIGLVIILVLLLPHKFSSILDFIETSYTGRSDFSESRFSKWEITYEIFIKNILSGVGQGKLRDYTYFQAHNAWVELMAENGIFSIIFTFWILYALISKGIILTRELLKRNDMRGYVLLGNLSGLVSMIVMLCSVSLFTVIYFWFQVGYVLLMIYFFKKESTVFAREVVIPSCNE